MPNSACVIIRHLDYHFLHQSCLHHVVFQHSRFEQEFPQFVGQKVSQKVAYQCLSGKRIPYDFKRLVSARLARYFPLESFESCIPSALDHYKSSHATLGFAPALSHFRIICNHWCTFSRFGKKDHPCCFGCGFHSDLVSHTVVCPKFLKLFFGTCRIPYHSIEFRDLVLLRGPRVFAEEVCVWGDCMGKKNRLPNFWTREIKWVGDACRPELLPGIAQFPMRSRVAAWVVRCGAGKVAGIGA